MDKKKIGITVTGSILSLLFLCYFGMAFYFDQVFCPNTSINGVDVSMQKVSDVMDLLEDSQKVYQLRVVDIDGNMEIVSGTSIDHEYSYDGIWELKKSEMGWQWPIKFLTHTDYSFEPSWTYDSDKLNSRITWLTCMKQEMIAPTNASLTIDANSFYLAEESWGNTLKEDEVRIAIAQAIDEGKTELDLAEADCYVKPEITMESAEIQEQLEEVNQLCQAEITYDFHGQQEVVGTELIRTWVRRDSDGNLYVSWDAAYAYLKELSAKYDTVYTYREFKNSWGNVITLRPGNYGWLMNTYTETNQILDDIANNRVVTREPAYSMTPYDNLDPDSPDDIGDTYVEIDLSSQHMWYYLDGELFLQTPITSGTLYNGWGTPAGVYYIYNRLQNVTLVGDDYRTPVNYWMQVNGGIGIHDSLWRYVYGGTEYLYNGSHGCINTPYNAVESLFWNIEVGVPVVMYY